MFASNHQWLVPGPAPSCGFWASPLYPDLEPRLHVSLTCILPRVSCLETTDGFTAPCLSFYAYICVIADWELPNNKICIKNRQPEQ